MGRKKILRLIIGFCETALMLSEIFVGLVFNGDKEVNFVLSLLWIPVTLIDVCFRLCLLRDQKWYVRMLLPIAAVLFAIVKYQIYVNQ
mgnify:CR=1 FL=1